VEPLNEKELSELLRKWQAPVAPDGLRGKFFPHAERLPWWRWLWRGSIRVPVPLALILFVTVTLSVSFAITHRQPRAVTLADFQPVKQLQPRIIRSNYDGN